MTNIYIRNFKQACSYIANGVKPVDIKYENGRLVFVFIKSETKDVWMKWLNHDLNI
ncbi:MAG: hypothetical protein ACRDD7_06320 [Peptostreptococcaceae bacterium]